MNPLLKWLLAKGYGTRTWRASETPGRRVLGWRIGFVWWLDEVDHPADRRLKAPAPPPAAEPGQGTLFPEMDAAEAARLNSHRAQLRHAKAVGDAMALELEAVRPRPGFVEVAPGMFVNPAAVEQIELVPERKPTRLCADPSAPVPHAADASCHPHPKPQG